MGVYTFRSSDRPVGQTVGRINKNDDDYSDDDDHGDDQRRVSLDLKYDNSSTVL